MNQPILARDNWHSLGLAERMKSLGQDNLFVDCEDSIDMKIGNVTNEIKNQKKW